MPELIRPTVAVRDSFLAGEKASCAVDGASLDWLEPAVADFAAFVDVRKRDRERWGVPATELWLVSGTDYLGALTIRHALTPALRHDGGHIGYHVVPQYRRQGHATAMLARGCEICRDEGMTEVLVTCMAENTGSRRVIEANGGVLEPGSDGICRYWITLSGGPAT